MRVVSCQDQPLRTGPGSDDSWKALAGVRESVPLALTLRSSQGASSKTLPNRGPCRPHSDHSPARCSLRASRKVSVAAASCEAIAIPWLERASCETRPEPGRRNGHLAKPPRWLARLGSLRSVIGTPLRASPCGIAPGNRTDTALADGPGLAATPCEALSEDPGRNLACETLRPEHPCRRPHRENPGPPSDGTLAGTFVSEVARRLRLRKRRYRITGPGKPLARLPGPRLPPLAKRPRDTLPRLPLARPSRSRSRVSRRIYRETLPISSWELTGNPLFGRLATCQESAIQAGPLRVVLETRSSRPCGYLARALR